MHTSTYVTGLLFHPESQQILLHQPQKSDDSPILWSMFGGINEDEDGAIAFQKVILGTLGTKIANKHIHPVYDYFHGILRKTNFVYYARVKRLQNFVFKGETCAWFTFKQTLKLRFAPETKQDIMVTQRVIDAAERVATNTQYFRPPPPVDFRLPVT